jgi:hypothetical protein
VAVSCPKRLAQMSQMIVRPESSFKHTIAVKQEYLQPLVSMVIAGSRANSRQIWQGTLQWQLCRQTEIEAWVPLNSLFE